MGAGCFLQGVLLLHQMKVIPFTPVGDVFVSSTSVLPAWTTSSLRITAVDDDKETPGSSFLLRRSAAVGSSPSSSQLGALLTVVRLPSARRRPGHVPPQASGPLEGGERLYVVEQEWQETSSEEPTIRSFSFQRGPGFNQPFMSLDLTAFTATQASGGGGD